MALVLLWDLILSMLWGPLHRRTSLASQTFIPLMPATRMPKVTKTKWKGASGPSLCDASHSPPGPLAARLMITNVEICSTSHIQSPEETTFHSPNAAFPGSKAAGKCGSEHPPGRPVCAGALQAPGGPLSAGGIRTATPSSLRYLHPYLHLHHLKQ